ncbi:MAG: right-handed parallel beta-helix repeat-containing protein [Chloroflexales bacterium]|nr:right-handed parallel beta-helix repeat-containing protein [Chloroflexales bacterium]
MTPRRQMLLLLSALALLLYPFALAPRAVEAAGDYTVDTTADLSFDSGTAIGTYCLTSGPPDCSLRRAIGEANRDGIPSQIFVASNLITAGVATFPITSGLGSLIISAPDLTIDARPTPPLTGVRVRIDGAGATFPGLKITSRNVTIYGLSITGFTGQLAPQGAGVLIEGPGATGNTISDNFIGVLPDGATTAGNLYGVRITGGASNNTITRNTIGASDIAGVSIENSGTNTVSSSSIGIGVGDVALRNGEAGIIIASTGVATSTGNIIGGVSPGLANTISGNGPAGRNDRAGILLTGAGTTGNFIRANQIGINGLGTTAVPNSGDGIRVESGASNNTIGGTATPLVISGNNGYGIRITGTGSISNTVSSGVYVGLNGSRDGPLGNALGGIAVDSGASATRIDGSTIAGHTSTPGVLITGTGVTGTVISSSFIGRVPNPTGTGDFLSLPNLVGVQILGAGSTSILTTTIGSNTQAGVQVQSTSPVTVSASTIISNTQAGVLLDGTSGSLVRTSIISGNLQSGLVLSGTLNTTVFTNTVAANSQTGVLVRGAGGTSVLSNTITGNGAGGLLLETAGLSVTTGTNVYTNTVSGNSLFGLRLSGAVTTTLRRNYVGLNPAHNDRLPNTGNGVEVFDSRNTYATDTYVAGNTGAGIVISGTGTLSTTFNNTVAGLSDGGTGFIVSEANAGPAVRITGGALQTSLSSGTLAGDATTAAGPPGVLIEGTSTITVSLMRIGWVTTTISPSSPPISHPFGAGISVTGTLSNVNILTNTLRYSQGPAIAVTGNAGRVRMLGNGLSGNGAGIALAGTSVLTARPPAADTPTASLTNPNHDIDPPPVDVTTFSDPLRLRVGDTGVIDGYVITSTVRTEAGVSPVSACISCTIQVFRPGPEASPTSGQGYETLLTYPVGGNAIDATSSFSVNDNGRFTRQIYGGLGAPGAQLLLIATDGFGNSSEYSAFPVSTGFSLTNLTGPTSHAPGDVVTYTLRLSNTGTLDVTGLKLQTQGTLAGWGVSTDPVTNTVFTLPTPLEAGTSRLITVTLTLPRGPNPNVQAGITDVTTVTVIKDSGALSQAVRLETTVLPRPVLVVSPTVSLGSARPTETVPHTHVIRNDGNVTVTLGIAETTIDDVGATGLWATSVNTRSFILVPGGEARVRIDVTVPEGAQVDKPGGGLVEAITYVTATVPLSPTGGFGPITALFSDTTRVDLDPDALITDGNQEQDGAAGQSSTFTHFVQNLSNRATRFCFVWSTNLGSRVSFRSLNADIAIDSNGCFNLDTVTDVQAKRYQSMQFQAIVLVDRRGLPGSTETLSLTVREDTTKVTIGSATVTDRINVIYGLVQPRIWMPLLRR